MSETVGQLELTGNQRKFLRGRAHSLSAVVQIGRAGLTDTVLGQIDDELSRHELVKIRIQGEREQRGEWSQQIADTTGAGIAGAIGHVVILYRPHAEPEKRRIELPT
jgi:RNA-binding protein